MKIKILILVCALFGLSIFLGGCATGLTPSSWAGMTADDNNVYLAGGSFVYALSLDTGAQVWSYPEKASRIYPFYAAPVLTPDGQLVVGGFDKKLYSLDPQSGAVKANWPFTMAKDRWIGSVLVANNTIYAPNSDYNLYALNLQGVMQWVFPADQSIWGGTVSDGSRVYFGTLGRNIYAVEMTTGEQAWDTGVDGAVLGTPVLKNDVLYLGTYGGTVYALDKADGKIQWNAKISDWIWSGPVLDENRLYVGDGNGNLYALDATDGKEIWRQSLNGEIVGNPLVAGGNIVVGTGMGNLYFFDRDGNQIRNVSVSGKIYSTPVAAGSLILVAPSEATADQPILVAFDQNGVQQWSFTPQK